MGMYLNPDVTPYKEIFDGDIFVDKTLLIEYTNHILGRSGKCICISRPRRFGKSTDANMLVAYYSKGINSKSMFDTLKISKEPTYLTHLNQHNVIHLNMQSFLSKTHSVQKMLRLLTLRVVDELKEVYPISFFDEENLILCFDDIFTKRKERFVFVVDEWDCVFREFKQDKEAQKDYLDFLRDLLKDNSYVELCYMTGILPIKKYGTHSALNMFKEISVLNPTPLEEFMGFTEKEVEDLCKEYGASYPKIKEWYDGYRMSDTISVYNPRSVVYSLLDKKFENYWTQTETFEALKIYIDLNFDGLKDDVVKMLAGEEVEINTSKFQNDMTTFHSKDDVFTLLIHLGYLGYNSDNKTCYIPNYEVSTNFVDCIESSNWNATTQSLQNSRKLLEATWKMDAEKVAQYIEEAHLETSHIQYNDENALSYTISLAYYAARDSYTVIRELPTGKGYADLVFIPKNDKPAMLIELKWNKDVETALTQIKEKKYPAALENYKGNLLLVGITYDKKSRKHVCKIEKCK